MAEHNPQGERGAERIRDENQDRIPPPVPDINTPSAGELFEDDTRKQLNLLRERTFNPELRELVDRVRENEPRPVLFEKEAPDGQTLSDEDLRLRLYRLYYRTRVLSDNREMNISFNPFEKDERSPDISGHDALVEYITATMEQTSLSPFALLSYSIVEKGYIPTVHNLKKYQVENIVISLHDALFKTIMADHDGIILDAGTIGGDPFLEKIFSPTDGEPQHSLYFVLLGSIVSSIPQELQASAAEPITPFLPSSILMIELPLQTMPFNTGAICSTLRKKLALPIFLLNDNQSLVFASENYEDLDYSYHVLDYLFTLFMLNHDRVGVSIKARRRENTSRTFLMKYIISQLSYKLFADSVIVHIIRGHLVILTKDRFLDVIQSLVNEYNKLFDDQFAVALFRPDDFEDSLDIIRRIILAN